MKLRKAGMEEEGQVDDWKLWLLQREALFDFQMIKFASWNIRGLNDPSKHSEVRHLVHSQKLSCIALLETKIKPCNKEKIEKTLIKGWDSLNFYDGGCSGRIWVWWDPNKLRADVVSLHDQIFHLSITLLGSDAKFAVSFAYGSNDLTARRRLWDNLKSQAITFAQLPWLVMGDFNAIRFRHERKGGSSDWPGFMDDFNDALFSAGLEDLRYGGCFFTWHNSRTQGPILRKLDRALVNPPWFNFFAQSAAEFLPFGLSDHSPAVVNLGVRLPLYKSPFKFFNFWSEFDEFFPLIEEIWGKPVAGYAMFRVYKKLKLVKTALKALCQSKNKLINGDLDSLRTELAALQSSIASGTNDKDHLEKAMDCAKRLSFASRGKESYARQRSRIQWLKEGDHNTAFFFNSIKGRFNVNKILSIQNDNGDWIREKDQITHEVVRFYKQLLGSECGSPYDGSNMFQFFKDRVLSPDQISMLSCDFTDDDIKSAFFSLHPNKSPGPDGFNAFFFHRTWHIVGADITTAIREFFSNGILLKEANSTIVALIPKVPNASKLKDFRPISCCNSIYKCISKLLALRLKAVLPSIINDAQSAFVQARHIGDNILMAQELVRGYHLPSSAPNCTLKIDLMKAFDSVRWDFLWDSLRLLGFPAIFIGWIKACVSSAKYSISINGELNGFFEGKKGLRQGDPISPYLFVICMDVFSRILDLKIQASTSFKFHWRCRKSNLSHLCFADDLLVFCRGDLNSIHVVKDALDTFSSLSGLTPNSSKSSIFLSGLPASSQHELANFIGYKMGSFPIRYLGVPLISSKLKALDCQALVDRILKRIKLWTNRFLSYAGRLQLIQSVIFSIQTFWSSHFILPAKVIKDIEGILSAFLWKGTSLSRSGAKVAWSDISCPKAEGGLGIKKIRDWNSASMTRYIWLLCQPCSNSLWAAWVKRNLLHKDHFWVAKVPWNCSWTWRKILKLRDRVKAHISVKVGNGEDTSLWFDSWRPLGPICTSSNSRVISDSGLGKNATVSAILSAGFWRWPVANSVELIALKDDSRSLPLPDCSHQDKILWDGSSVFSIKGVWNCIRTSRRRVDWAHLLWFPHHVPRHSFILWLAIRGRLSTQDRLQSFGVQSHLSCFLCQSRMEDHCHLFFNCPFSSRIWSSIAYLNDLEHFPFSWEILRPWLTRNIKGSSLHSIICRLSVGASVYFIWVERNSRKHGNSHINEAGIISMIKESVRMSLDGAIIPKKDLNLRLIDRWQLSPSLLR